ncbi:MAG: hypothetical protein AAF658_19670 [Myxococcota bacterium]
MRLLVVGAGLVWFVGCSHAAYTIRVPVHDASYEAMLDAATRAMDTTAGSLDRTGSRRQVRLKCAKGVEEVEVIVRRERDATQLEVFVSRPELYPPGVAESFWRRFRHMLDEERKSWLVVETGERRANL